MRRICEWVLDDQRRVGAILLGLLAAVVVGLTILSMASGDLSHSCNLGQGC